MKYAMTLFCLLIAVNGASQEIEPEEDSHKSCRDAYNDGYRRNGPYTIFPESDKAGIDVWCNMETDYKGSVGGWTLVMGNSRGGAERPFTDLNWYQAVHTRPMWQGFFEPLNEGEPQLRGLERFNVFVGIEYMRTIANTLDNSRDEIMYAWVPNYGESDFTNVVACSFRLEKNNDYAIVFEKRESGPDGFDCEILKGGIMTAFMKHSNGKKFTTIDNDNDPWTHSNATYGNNCATNYGVPFWYNACAQGGVYGVQDHRRDYYRGAFWTNIEARKTGDGATAKGAGNGWIFVR